jgi:hypothetical protein
VLREELKQLPSPFTLGLLGPWGSGKSTILRAVGEAVQDDVTAYATFDVWKYEGDPLRRQFVIAIAQQLRSAKQLRRRFKLKRHLERFDADIASPRSRWQIDWRRGLRALPIGALVAGALYLTATELPSFGVDEQETTRAVIAILAGGIVTVIAAVGGLFGVRSDQVTRRRLEDADGFASSFTELIGSGLKAPQLIVGIDNLDRCAPERVSELLATIKTFLEPARQDKRLVFVIAADDAALRRHLLAQELTRSPGSGRDEDSRADPEAARAAVDEYLRKYFNGVIRLERPMAHHLDQFVDEQVASALRGGLLDRDTATAIASMLTRFLGGNPRRIKQFVNVLLLRLAVLHGSGPRGEACARDPIAVAELLLLQERWPDRMEQLMRHPRAFRDDWFPEAIEDSELDEPSPADPEWLAFVRSTIRLSEVDPRHFLAVDEPPEERGLASLEAFEAAVDQGSVEQVAMVLSDSGADAERLATLVPAMFQMRLADQYYGAAGNLLAATICLDVLAGEDRARAASLLSRALPWPRLSARLHEIPADALIPVLERLDEQARTRAIDVLLGVFATDDARRAELAVALAERGQWLTPDHRRTIQSALRVWTVTRDVASWAPLAHAQPPALPDWAIAHAGEYARGGIGGQRLAAPSKIRTQLVWRVAKALGRR